MAVKVSSSGDGSNGSAVAVVPPADPFATKEVYKDNVFDRFMINYFSRTMSNELGGLPYDGSYESFVDLSREMMRGRNTQQQQEAVAGVLVSLLPPQAPANFRKWFPFNKLNSEVNAFITTLGFTWLIEVDYQGRKEEWLSGVEIKKCRYLESSGCVGLCVNLCKLPTQKFFTETFGLPLTMNPNFEDLSCEMAFGQYPPPVEQDKVYNQPCFAKQCNLVGNTVSSKDLSKPCPKIDTERQKKERTLGAAGRGKNGGGLFSLLRALTPGKADR
ncbi:hypothetical protein N2152v2_002595 [Parachlorella kessleri]